MLLACGLTPHTERHVGDGHLARAAKALGRSVIACTSRYSRLMRQRGHTGGQWTTVGLWTPEQDEVIRAHLRPERVPPGTWQHVAELLGRTPGAVSTRAVKLRKQLRRDMIPPGWHRAISFVRGLGRGCSSLCKASGSGVP